MRLLIVKDNSGIWHVISSMVASVVYEIREGADGAEELPIYTSRAATFGR